MDFGHFVLKPRSQTGHGSGVLFLHFGLDLGMFSVVQKNYASFSSLSIRPSTRAMHNTFNNICFFLIENSFLRLYSPSIIHYNHLHYNQIIVDKAGDPGRSSILKQGTEGRSEIGYKFKCQVINRVKKQQNLIVNRVRSSGSGPHTAPANFSQIRSIVCEAK